MNNEDDTPEHPDEYHAFKVLPREFSSALDDDLDSDAGPQETCRAVADRLVARLEEECGKVGAGPEVVEADVVRCVYLAKSPHVDRHDANGNTAWPKRKPLSAFCERSNIS